MTTFRLDASPGPGTHVFILGVGKYPHLKDGNGRPAADHRGLGQLTSPPHSAMAMLEWFDKNLHNPDAPLKSIEVLVSQDPPVTYTDTQGKTATIDEASWAKFEDAADAWFKRHDTDPDNVAVFYFCGHGTGDGTQTYLMMSDTGAGVFLRNALTFTAFRMGVGQSKALKQLFLIDACRTVDVALLLSGAAAPVNSGLPVNVTRIHQGHSPVLYSARMGERAFATPGRISDFTAALLEGLNRFGVFKLHGRSWVVQPKELQSAVSALMDDFSGKPPCDLDGIKGNGFPLHVLRQPPEVVVHVMLDDPAASATASISCHAAGKDVVRTTGDHPWRTALPEGHCDFKASFAQPSAYQAATDSQYLKPPFQDVRLEVT